VSNEEQGGLRQRAFAAAVMRQLEGAVLNNFDVHDVEQTLGDGSGLTVSEVALTEVTEEAISQAVHGCLDAMPVVPQGVLVLLEVVPRLSRLRFQFLMSQTVRHRFPNIDVIPVCRDDLQGPPLARLTLWCRTS
jgi:hypothetical protein